MALIDKLTAIGDAIRDKLGTTKTYTLDEMVTAISLISGSDSFIVAGKSDSFQSLKDDTVTVDVGFKPSVIMLTYSHPNDGHTVINVDCSDMDTYELFTAGAVSTRDNVDGGTAGNGYGYIALTDSGFTFKGRGSYSGEKTVHYACYRESSTEENTPNFLDVSKWTPRGSSIVTDTGAGIKICVPAGTTSHYSGATYSEPIDVTGVDEITVNIGSVGGLVGSGYHSVIALVSKIQTSSDSLIYNAETTGDSAVSKKTITGAGEFKLNTSNLSGLYYLYIQSSYSPSAYVIVNRIEVPIINK